MIKNAVALDMMKTKCPSCGKIAYHSHVTPERNVKCTLCGWIIDSWHNHFIDSSTLAKAHTSNPTSTLLHFCALMSCVLMVIATGVAEAKWHIVIIPSGILIAIGFFASAISVADSTKIACPKCNTLGTILDIGLVGWSWGDSVTYDKTLGTVKNSNGVTVGSVTTKETFTPQLYVYEYSLVCKACSETYTSLIGSEKRTPPYHPNMTANSPDSGEVSRSGATASTQHSSSVSKAHISMSHSDTQENQNGAYMSQSDAEIHYRLILQSMNAIEALLGQQEVRKQIKANFRKATVLTPTQPIEVNDSSGGVCRWTLRYQFRDFLSRVEYQTITISSEGLSASSDWRPLFMYKVDDVSNEDATANEAFDILEHIKRTDDILSSAIGLGSHTVETPKDIARLNRSIAHSLLQIIVDRGRDYTS